MYKQIIYPLNTALDHHYGIVTTQNSVIPNYFLQLLSLGAAALTMLLVSGIMILIDRIRSTPVVRARTNYPNQILNDEILLLNTLNLYKGKINKRQL